LIAKFNKKVITRSVPVEEFYYEGWSDVDQESEPGWDMEELSGSTGIKEDFEPSSMQVEQENPSVEIIETSFKSYTFEFLLLRLNLSEGDVVTFVDPCLDLLDGKVRMEDFPLINVCLMEDFFYSSDNQRLYCFKEAIKRGLDVDRIPVRIRQEVVVSPSSRNGRVIDGKGYWEEQVENYLDNYINNWHERRRNDEIEEHEEREKQRQYEREERQKEHEEQEKREAREREEREKQRQYEREERQKEREKRQKRENNIC
ncbi:4189_t:CDS:2, partial [Dentiscutata erythropus]